MEDDKPKSDPVGTILLLLVFVPVLLAVGIGIVMLVDFIVYFLSSGDRDFNLFIIVLIIPISALVMVLLRIRRSRKISKKIRLLQEKGYDGYAKFLYKEEVKFFGLISSLAFAQAGMFSLMSIKAAKNYDITYSYTDENGEEHKAKLLGFFSEKCGLALEQYGDIPIKFIGQDSNIAIDFEMCNEIRLKAKEIWDSKKIVENIANEQKSIKQEGVDYIVVTPVDLRTDPVFAVHNIIALLPEGTTLTLLEKGEQTTINNTEGHWVKVQGNFFGRGWCFSGNLKEV